MLQRMPQRCLSQHHQSHPCCRFYDYQQPLQQPVASGSYAYDDQQQQQGGQQQAGQEQYPGEGEWYYGGPAAAGQYQMADYEAPAGADGAAAPVGDGYAAGSSSGTTEFTFPAAYSDGSSAAAGEAADGYDPQQQPREWGPPPPQQPQQPGGPAGGRGASYDLDDW